MLGPGQYIPDVTEGVTSPADLPKPRIEQRSRNFRSRRCPHCGLRAGRYARAARTLHDLGDPRSGRPINLVVTYSKHHCCSCDCYFLADLSDLALPKCQYTRRVQDVAVRLVAEDGLPYQTASWHLWRDRRVFVPFATIQNWVEAAGEKKMAHVADRLPQRSPGGLQRLPDHR